MSKTKNYYAVVNRDTRQIVDDGDFALIFLIRKDAAFYKSPSRTVAKIPQGDLNRFIQKYIPSKPVDQEPGN